MNRQRVRDREIERKSNRERKSNKDRKSELRNLKEKLFIHMTIELEIGRKRDLCKKKKQKNYCLLADEDL